MQLFVLAMHIGYCPIMASSSRALQVHSLYECVANLLGYHSDQKAVITILPWERIFLLYLQWDMGKISAMHSLVDNCHLPFASEISLPQPMQIIVIDAMLKTIIDTCHYKYIANVLA